MNRRRLLPLLVGMVILVGCDSGDGGSAGNASGWSKAVAINAGEFGNAQLPGIGFDDDGNALAVWYEADEVETSIWSNRYVPEQGWGEPELVEEQPGDALDPSLAVAPDGSAFTVWVQDDGERLSVYAARFVSGEGWSSRVLLESGDSGDAGQPQVVVGADGNAMAVWRQYTGSRADLWASQYVAGIGWDSAELIEGMDSHSAAEFDIGMDADGNVLVVWQHDGIGGPSIFHTRYVAGEGWTYPAMLEEDDDSDATLPKIAVAADGSAIAVWQQRDDIRDNIWASRYVVGEGWDVPVLIEFGTGAAFEPEVGIDADGNAVAVWHQFVSVNGASVYASHFNTGSGWQAPQLLEDSEGDSHQPRIVLDGDGNAHAVWWKSNLGKSRIWSNSYEAGSGWADAVQMRPASDAAAAAQLAVDGDGHVVAIWTQVRSGVYGIFTSLLAN